MAKTSWPSGLFAAEFFAPEIIQSLHVLSRSIGLADVAVLMALHAHAVLMFVTVAMVLGLVPERPAPSQTCTWRRDSLLQPLTAADVVAMA